jgi:hypothetical protein
MATIGSASSSSYENTSRRSYISTMAFNLDFFTYTTSVDSTTYATTGTLTTVSGATSVNSPLGRVLRETGRKLVPGANPGITVYMVEVFDNTTFLRGYINPNSPVFAPFNSDRPAFMEEPYVINQDVSGGTYGAFIDPITGLPSSFAGTQNYGASVLTRGNILTDGYIESGGQIRCLQQVNLTQLVTNNQTLEVVPAVGQTFNISIGNGNAGVFTTTLTLASGSYAIGDRITIYASLRPGAASPNTCTLAFSADFITSGNIVNSTYGVTKTYSISFHCVSTATNTIKMVEVSRVSF